MFSSMVKKVQNLWLSHVELSERVPVNKCNDDVLNVDMLMQLSTGTQKRVQGLKMELIGKNLAEPESWRHIEEEQTVD